MKEYMTLKLLISAVYWLSIEFIGCEMQYSELKDLWIDSSYFANNMSARPFKDQAFDAHSILLSNISIRCSDIPTNYIPNF